MKTCLVAHPLLANIATLLQSYYHFITRSEECELQAVKCEPMRVCVSMCVCVSSSVVGVGQTEKGRMSERVSERARERRSEREMERGWFAAQIMTTDK